MGAMLADVPERSGTPGWDGAPDLLAGIEGAEIRLDPFPHIVMTDVLPPAVLETLRRSRPRFADIGWAGQPPNGRRIPCSTVHFLGNPNLPAVWRAFSCRQAEPDMLRRVLDRFAPVLPEHCPEVWAWARTHADPSFGLLYRDEAQGPDILTDARLEITTPVRAGLVSHRRAHVDTPNRLFTGLFYLRDEEDDTEGGDLGLYRWKGEPGDATKYEVDADAVDLVSLVPYRANTLVLFPNSPKALHGVTPRPPSPHERAYLFFTAEIGEPLW